jgi:hypothetical protein
MSQHQVHFTAARRADAPKEDLIAVLEHEDAAPRPGASTQEQAAQDWIMECVDGRDLQQLMATAPTVENLARYLYQGCAPLLPGLTRVRVSPGPGTWAAYQP